MFLRGFRKFSLPKLSYQLIFSIVLLSCLNYGIKHSSEEIPIWKWACTEGKCVKTRSDHTGAKQLLSFESCRMFCMNDGFLWPKPTGKVNLGRAAAVINGEKIRFDFKRNHKADNITSAAIERFLKKLVPSAVPKGMKPNNKGKLVDVYLDNKNPDLCEFSLKMDESYSLNTSVFENKIKVIIDANTFFGIRHGIETLSQLIIYDDIRNELMLVRDVSITDKPIHTYRGILLDTARKYYNLETIKKTIDTMATVKLNSFHWHITDSQSFPFVSKRKPKMAKLGAFSPSKVYTKENIREVVQYGLERGVRVVPEFDTPSHVGEGWQDTNLTVCMGVNPWQIYCGTPPCGQLNPVKEELYDYLEEIYADFAEYFQPDLFHMGGDEVSALCWNYDADIQKFSTKRNWTIDEAGSLLLWDYFQMKAQTRVYQAFGKKIPLIIWTSALTESSDVMSSLNIEDYIIQVWSHSNSPDTFNLLQRGFSVIISNYDAYYLDKGAGSSRCSEYIGWEQVYQHSPVHIAGDYKQQVLGGEATIWSEYIDEGTLEGRLWPRGAALAERLWTEPNMTGDVSNEVVRRMLHMRERLVRLGVHAEVITTEWCYQNENSCFE